MSWNKTKRVGSFHVYDLEPERVKVADGDEFTIGRRTWKSAKRVPIGTEIEVFCQVGCLSRSRPSYAVVRLPNGVAEMWAATDNAKKKKPKPKAPEFHLDEDDDE